ncbi:hypothetical protein BH24ACT15_BH24ACT15_25820 [soil metagenome]
MAGGWPGDGRAEFSSSGDGTADFAGSGGGAGGVPPGSTRTTTAIVTTAASMITPALQERASVNLDVQFVLKACLVGLYGADVSQPRKVHREMSR